MASVYGVNATKAADPSPSNILNPGTLGGKVRVMVDSYEAAALAAASTITIGKALPVGAIVIGGKLSWDALGAGVTLAVGDATTADRYLAATAAAAAGIANLPDDVDGLSYVITGTADTVIKITTAVAAATGTISIIILYVLE